MSFDRAAWCRLGAALCLLVGLAGLFWPQLAPFVANTTAGADGFLLQAMSKPSGAQLAVNGTVVGTTPFLGSVACGEGDEIRLEISSKGFQPWKREVKCRVGERLEVNARLER